MSSKFDPFSAVGDSTIAGGGISASTSAAMGVLSLPAAIREKPMFALNTMNIELRHDIEQLVVSNQTMVVLMSNMLHRISLRAVGDPIERLAELPTGVRIVRMFLDPLGSHLLATVRLTAAQTYAAGGGGVGVGGSVATHELWYLHRTAREPKRCERYRGHEITAVGWNRAVGSDAATGAIMLGTSRGVIFETEFSCVPAVSENWKQLPNYLPLYGSRDVDGVVFDIGKGELCPITGLEFGKVNSTGPHIVLVTTARRLYTFHEDLRTLDESYPYLHHIFTSYLNKPEPIYAETDSTKNAGSTLRLAYATPTSTYPLCYGWLTADGLTIGEFDADAATEKPFLATKQTLPWPRRSAQQQQQQLQDGNDPAADRPPIAFELTDHHVLFLFADRIVAVSRLTHAVVYEDVFDPMAGLPLGMAADQRAGGIVYLFGRKAIQRVRVRDEQRHVWRQHLERGEFELARRSTQNAAHLNAILIGEADVCFERAEYARAAQLYGESRACFETVCLRFMRGGLGGGGGGGSGSGSDVVGDRTTQCRDGLRQFVRLRLDKLRAADKTQITMLVVWLTELYVTELATARCGIDGGAASATDRTQRQRRLQSEFDAFVASPRVIDCVGKHPTVFYGLMAAHGDEHNLQALTAAVGDHEQMIEQHIVAGQYGEALRVLCQQATRGDVDRTEWLYRYAPLLMEELPAAMGELLRSPAVGGWLDAERLLPALICLDTEVQRAEVIRYLEWSVHKQACGTQTVHNYLVHLYAKYRPDRLMEYLTNEGLDERTVHYDVQFALRVCNQHECNEASVFLYCLLELWQPAVKLALRVSPLLAEQTASLPADSDARRKLWLQIAKHRIEAGGDVRQALSVLSKCDGLLRLEDVLPFFGQFDRIDAFKEATIEALSQYMDEAQHLRDEMEETSRAVELVRDELRTVRQRSVRLRPAEQCSLCRVALMQRPFFVFHCGHRFHEDCMEREVVKELESDDKLRLAKLHDRMSTATNVVTAQTDGDSVRLTDRERAVDEYEELIASECWLCGNRMIDSIDRPFCVDGQKSDMNATGDWL